MKISKNLILPCVLALGLSLSSFSSDKKEKSHAQETARGSSFNAYLFAIPKSNKIKLIIDRENVSKLRIVLSGKNGKVYYSEVFNENEAKYRRSFNMNDLSDGTYYFEVYNKNQKMIKEVKVHSALEKMVSLL